MTAHVLPQRNIRRSAHGRLMLPFACLASLVLAAGIVVSYMLWPTWPSAPVPLNAPAIPITVANVLFDVPPAAIRAAVQRHPGPHERADLVFLWPSLTPPQPQAKGADQPAAGNDDRPHHQGDRRDTGEGGGLPGMAGVHPSGDRRG